MAAKKKRVRVGMLPTVRVDTEGKVIPSRDALEVIRQQHGIPTSVAAAARCHNLAISRTLLSAWYGTPARYDHNEGVFISRRVAAEIARELHAIEQQQQASG